MQAPAGPRKLPGRWWTLRPRPARHPARRRPWLPRAGQRPRETTTGRRDWRSSRRPTSGVAAQALQSSSGHASYRLGTYRPGSLADRSVPPSHWPVPPRSQDAPWTPDQRGSQLCLEGAGQGRTAPTKRRPPSAEASPGAIVPWFPADTEARSMGARPSCCPPCRCNPASAPAPTAPTPGARDTGSRHSRQTGLKRAPGRRRGEARCHRRGIRAVGRAAFTTASGRA